MSNDAPSRFPDFALVGRIFAGFLFFGSTAKETTGGTHDRAGSTAVLSRLQRFLIQGGVAALAAACDANVVIGARLSLTEGGGAGQAIQSMNLMLGLDERLSLEDPGSWP